MLPYQDARRRQALTELLHIHVPKITLGSNKIAYLVVLEIQLNMAHKKPSYLSSIFGLKCPRCRRGRLFTSANPFNFRKITDMPEKCEVCEQDFVIEPGFYFGATYVSYAFNVAWLVPLFLLVRFILGYPFNYYVIAMFVLLPILVPLISRLSRAIWLGFFVKFDPTTLDIDQVKKG